MNFKDLATDGSKCFINAPHLVPEASIILFLVAALSLFWFRAVLHLL
jgi:hypothetical protein